MSLTTACLLLGIGPVFADGKILHVPIGPALEKAMASGRLPTEMRFYFGAQGYPEPVTLLGPTAPEEDTQSRESRVRATCDWAFFSALLAMVTDAEQAGGNAVVRIRSSLDGNEVSSDTTSATSAATSPRSPSSPSSSNYPNDGHSRENNEGT